MKKTLGLMFGFALLFSASTLVAHAAPAPEIDGSTLASGISLIAGSIFILRSRKRR